MYNMESPLLTTNVDLHYFNLYYLASNFFCVRKYIPKFEQSFVRTLTLFIGKHVGGWWLLFVSYKGARYNDVNEVMHIRKRTVEIGGCCFTRCLVSPVEASRRSWFVSGGPTMIKRAGHRG